MASVPITSFTLYRVPFDRTYKHVTDFSSSAERDNYFATLPKTQTFTEAQYIRKNGTYNVPLLFDIVDGYNYIVYDNGEGAGKVYAWIDSCEFINFNTTKIKILTDPWQTNLATITSNFTNHNRVTKGYIKRKHCDRYKRETVGGDSIIVPNLSDAMVDEGTGIDADVLSHRELVTENHFTAGNTDFVWLAVSVIGLGANQRELGEHGSFMNAFDVFFVPVPIFDPDITFSALTGDDVTTTPLSPLSDLLVRSQSESIASITVLPYAPFDYSIAREGSTKNYIIQASNTADYSLSIYTFTASPDIFGPSVYIKGIAFGKAGETGKNQKVPRWINTGERVDLVDMVQSSIAQPSAAPSVPDSKLFCYPYCYYEMTAGGQKRVLRNEYRKNFNIKNNYLEFDSSVVALPYMTGVGLRVALQPNEYPFFDTDRFGDQINVTSSANIGLSTSASQEFWQNNATAASASINQNDIAQIAMNRNTAAISNAAANQAMGSVLGPGGAHMAYAGQGSAAGALASSAASSSAMALGGAASLGVGLGVAAVNKAVEIAAQYTKPHHIKSTSFTAAMEFVQRTYSGMIDFTTYTLSPKFRGILTDKFRRFGWAFDRVADIVLRTRYWYDYIETANVKIDGIGSIDEELAIEKMFDNGVTVWHCHGTTVKAYGDYASSENTELTFVS